MLIRAIAAFVAPPGIVGLTLPISIGISSGLPLARTSVGHLTLQLDF
jgi:hypothetical protein